MIMTTAGRMTNAFRVRQIAAELLEGLGCGETCLRQWMKIYRVFIRVRKGNRMFCSGMRLPRQALITVVIMMKLLDISIDYDSLLMDTATRMTNVPLPGTLQPDVDFVMETVPESEWPDLSKS